MSDRRRHVVRRHATTFVLVALTVGAGLWVMVAERRLPSTAEQEARRQNLLPTWDDAALTRVDVVSLRGAFALVRDEGVAPGDDAPRTFDLVRGDQRFAADPQQVDQLLTTLQLATVRRAVAEGSVDRGAMGLDTPAVRVTIAMGPITHRLAVGGVVPGDGRYVEVEGRGVFVVPAAVAEALAVEGDALRDRTLVPYAGRAIAALSLEGEGGTRRLERAPWPASGGGGFRFAEGGPRVSARALDAALEALGRFRAEVFPPGDGGPIEEPRLTLTLTPTEGAPAVLVIGGACPDRDELVLVHRTAPSPLRACVARDVLPPLLRSRADLEDTRLVGATLDEIVETRVERGSSVLEMARKGAGFAVRLPEPRDLPEAAARAFLDALLAAKGQLEVGAPARLDGEGAAELRIVSRPAAPGDPERVETVQIGPADGGRRWVRRVEDGATLVVDDAVARPLLTPELVLHERKVIDVPAEKVREVAIRGASVDQRIRRAGLGVDLVAPKGRGLSADEAWGLELFDRLAKLEAVRWVAPAADPAFGLDPPRFTVEVSIETDGPGSERTRTLRFGAPGDDGPFAQIDGDPAVFVAPEALEEAARRWLVDRGAFRVRPAEVTRLVASAGSGPALTLERVDGALVARSEAPDAAARAARVREGLDELVALEAVAIGTGRPEHGLEQPVVSLEVTPREGKPFRLVIGATDAREGESVHYARRSDVDAVFTVGRGPVRSLLEAVR